MSLLLLMATKGGVLVGRRGTIGEGGETVDCDKCLTGEPARPAAPKGGPA